MQWYDDIHSAYLDACREVLYNFDYKSAPRGLPILEKLDYSFGVRYPVNEPIKTFDKERNLVIADYTAKELELYNSCTNRVEDFAKASKFWEKIANTDGTVNSAYGYLIWKKESLGKFGYDYEKMEMAGRMTPWQWCVNSLKKDKDTRQAVLRFSLPEHHYEGNKDFVCTLNGNFSIRNDQLHLCIIMRSNDLMLGAVYDLPWFMGLMDRMIAELKSVYPNLTKGYYTHFVHSLHIYERDIEKIKKMIGE